MTIDFKDLRIVGLGAAVLMALVMALPWVTVSAPFIGSIGVSGYKAGGDGWVFLAGVVVTGVFAFFRFRKTTGILSIVLALGLIGEYVNASVSLKQELSAEADNEFAKALLDAVSLQPGMGLILGILLAAALATYAFVLGSRRKAEAPETPETPEQVATI